MLIVVALTGVYFSANHQTDGKHEEMVQQMSDRTDDQSELLLSIANSISRNTPIDEVSDIVKDCSVTNRNRFEGLLDSLDDNLSREELLELDTLFIGCGSYFADQRSLSIYVFDRELALYEVYVGLLSEMTGESNTGQYALSDWTALLAAEKTQAEHFSTLVDLQEDIIDRLLEGKASDSEEIVTILQEVSQVKESMLVGNIQASDIRARLTSS